MMKGNWIRITNALPPASEDGGESQYVLACTADGSVDVSYYHYIRRSWDGIPVGTVTHWRPIPDPPSKREREIVEDCIRNGRVWPW